MVRPFGEHHLSWLASHLHRSADWLREMMAAGFDVHHIDGDHDNNAPDNLVLIEHTDHMRMHGMSGVLGRLAPKRGKRGLQKQQQRMLDAIAARREFGEPLPWAVATAGLAETP